MQSNNYAKPHDFSNKTDLQQCFPITIEHVTGERFPALKPHPKRWHKSETKVEI